MNYYFLYTVTTGAILSQDLGTAAPFTPGTGEAILAVPTTDATAADAYANPTRYLIQGSPAALVAQPYWTLAAQESATTSGQYTLTATLNNPPATPPTTATFSTAGSTFTESITNNTATWTVQLHASVATEPVPLSVSASGTVSGNLTINNGTASTPLQAWTPVSGYPTVGPGGSDPAAYLRQTAFGLSDANLIPILVSALQALMATASSFSQVMLDVVFPAITQSTWKAVDLSAYQSVITNWTQNVLPNQVAFSSLLDSAGNPVPGYTDLQTFAPKVQAAWDTYNTWASEVPLPPAS